MFSNCTNNAGGESWGEVERIDAELDLVIGPDAVVEVIADGFEWTEGPLWIEEKQMLLFSDIPNNSVYQWTEAGGKKLYLKPSGYTGSQERGGETGSNGLALSANRKLLLAQHGDRRIAMMEATLDAPAPEYTTIADTYQGKRFNSPNDLVLSRTGKIYFTDPPYGLEKNMEDPGKELNFQGVYSVDQDGNVKLLTDTLTRPNGIAFSPDERFLYIANSDTESKTWHAFELLDNDSLGSHRLIHDATDAEGNGNPDGMKVDARGYLFATGPGGVWIFNPSLRLLGKIRTRETVSNCAFTDDQRTLFITADDYVLRVKLR